MNKWVPGWQPLRMAALGLMALGAAAAAMAQARIESISSSIQGGAEVVRIDFDQPLAAVPAGFVVQSPARIALDFPGVVSGLARSNVDNGTQRLAIVRASTDLKTPQYVDIACATTAAGFADSAEINLVVYR